jgi:hypothetical protein
MLSVFSLAGIEWTSKITTEGKKNRDNNLVTAHIYAQKGNLKQVFQEVSREDSFRIKNGYWLFKADEENIYIVNEEEKSYTELSLDSLLQMTGFIGQLVKIQILDHTIDSETLGNETIAGYNCNHLKLTTDYTMKMKIAFIKKTMKIHEVKEIWATSKLKGFDEINAAFLKKDFKTGIPDLDELIKKQMESQGKIGFPLKTITQTVQYSKKGKVTGDTTTTMEVSGINIKNFPNSFFEIPQDYQGVEAQEKKKLGVF